jgi:TRAP-type C4-dicarboxylate transport system permease large subunit
VNLGIGQQTPPVASVLMVACSLAKASVWEVTRVNLRFILVLFIILMLCTYWEGFGLGLVHLFYH